MGRKRVQPYGVAIVGVVLLVALMVTDAELCRSARVSLLSAGTGTEAGYAPNEDVRRAFARLEPGDLKAAYVNGEKLTPSETDALIAALRLSQRRVSGNDGPPLGPKTHEGGFVEFRMWNYLSGDLPRIGFAVPDPAGHHGPAFARAIRDALRRGSYEAQVARLSGKPPREGLTKSRPGVQ